MMDFANALPYITVALAVGINSVGTGLGEGWTFKEAIDAINIQPKALVDITKLALLGTALVETAAILGLTMSIILLFGMPKTMSVPNSLAQLGIIAAICLTGLVVGLVSSFPVIASCRAVARQPFFADKIMRLMLVTQAIIQTPIIFGFIIALFIRNQAATVLSLAEGLRLAAAGIALGLGSIGPAIGLAVYAYAACYSLGINKEAYGRIFSFSFVSQAIIETPIIFALVVSLLLVALSSGDSIVKGVAMLGSAFCIGLCTIGPGVSSGNTAAAACYQMAFNQEMASPLSRMSMLAQGLVDTAAIYGLLIAILLIIL